MRKFIMTFLVAGLSSAIFAQNEGEITGKVIDNESKQAVPFAILRLTSDSVLVMETQADLDGKYTLKPIQPGTYNLQVRAETYFSNDFYNIQVEARGLTYYDCELSKSVELPPIDVHPPLVDSHDPDIKFTLDESMLDNMPVANPVEAAAFSPATLQNEQTGGLFLAGSREDATMYVVDGVKVIGSVYVPMNAVKSVSVLTGGIPAMYGDFTGGIIEITTKGCAGIY